MTRKRPATPAKGKAAPAKGASAKRAPRRPAVDVLRPRGGDELADVENVENVLRPRAGDLS